MKFHEAKMNLLGILTEEAARTGASLRTLMIELMLAHNEHVGASESRVPITSSLNEQKNAIILAALKRTNWNQRAAAQALGMPKSTLNDWLKKNRINKPSPQLQVVINE